MYDESKKQDLVFSRVFYASVEEVWKAWMDPKYVMRWWGPLGFASPSGTHGYTGRIMIIVGGREESHRE